MDRSQESNCPPKRRLRVLLTEGSSLSARHTLFAIGQQHDVEVIDSKRFSICWFSSLVRRWHLAPSFVRQPEQFAEFLLDLTRRERFDVVLPTHEDIFLVSRLQKVIAKQAAIAVPDFEQFDELQSKAKFSRLLARLNLPQPQTYLASSCEDALEHSHDYPVYVKLPYSTGSQGVFRVEGDAELAELFNSLCRQATWVPGTDVLIQAKSVGVECSIVGVFRYGELVDHHAMKEWGKGRFGMPMARVSIHDSRVVADLAKIGKELHWHGPIGIAYFLDEASGRIEYLECNPRICETVNAVLSGANLCQAWIDVAMNQPTDAQACGSEAYQSGVRTYCGFLVLVAQAIDGANRRQLLMQLFHRAMGKGYFKNSQSELARPREDWMSWLPGLGVTFLLVLYPRASQWLVRTTVDHFSMSSQVAERVKTMSKDAIDAATDCGPSGRSA